MKNIIRLLTIAISIFYSNAMAQLDIEYQEPPEPLKSLVMAPANPSVITNPSGEWSAILEQHSMPGINQLSQPELRIAGIRINPRTNGPSRSRFYSSISFINTNDQSVLEVKDLASDALISNTNWSPDGKKFAFTITEESGISIWLYNLDQKQLHRITNAVVNDAIGGLPYWWTSDSKRLIYKSVLPNRGTYPENTLVPKGPIVQESSGKNAPSRTYQDLLKNKYDEELFTYFTTSQPMVSDLNGQNIPLGNPGIYSSLSLSPDGKYILAQKIKPPFSYLVPYYRFPQSYDIWDIRGTPIRQIADIPLSEEIPIGFNAVRKGPRSFSWRSDKGADLYWVEALDDGDPSKEVDFRDQLFHISEPFNGDKIGSIKYKLRYRNMLWGIENMAITNEYWWSTRQMITSLFNPDYPEGSKKIIFDRSVEDKYNDPGLFQTKMNGNGHEVLTIASNKKELVLFGRGASPEGNKPFVDLYNFKKESTQRLWQCEGAYYEEPVKILDLKKGILLTIRESKEEPPNVVLRNIKTNKQVVLTHFPNPYLALEGIEKQVIKYERSDGLPLKGNLYLPKGYDKSDGPLPVLMWAYPDEFKSKDAAGQVTGSPYEFMRIYYGSPIFWVTRGFAVFDDISMPVVGEEDEQPNDSFIDQLVMNAEAAIEKLDEMGVGDPERVAIGGHSYGAFMTANLLAHSDLFAAGIARSGAYNRTLTPFGFQAEERTFWEAPEVYFQMSPFMHASKVNEPILLIHGEADNNSGTFPIQSERFYNAVKGHGGITRLVFLPYESHGYRASESILHMLWEMDTWLQKYVKDKDADDSL